MTHVHETDATTPDTAPSSPTRSLIPMPTLPAAASLTAPLALIRQSRETEEHSLVKQPATQLFIYAYKHNSGNAPLGKNFGDTRRLKLALQLFKGFLTREERAQLLAKPKEEGDAKQEWQGSLERLASKLNMLAVKRLVQAFNDDNKQVPKKLASTTVILNVSSVETYFGKNNGNGLDYKDNKIDTVTAPDSLLAFRVDYEANLAAKRAASSAQLTTSAARPPKRQATQPMGSVASQNPQQFVLTSSDPCSYATCTEVANRACKFNGCRKLVCERCAWTISADNDEHGYWCNDHEKGR